MNRTNQQLLCQHLVGREIAAVTFVRGYIQIHFDGPYINIYGPISIYQETKEVHEGEVANHLIALVGEEVTSVEEHDSQLIIYLISKTLITINLDPNHSQGGEAAMFQDGTGKNWIVW